MATCGNGAVIGMAITIIHQVHQLILTDRLLVLVVCTVVAVGTTLLSSAECRIAVAATSAIAAVTLECGWLPNRLWAFLYLKQKNQSKNTDEEFALPLIVKQLGGEFLLLYGIQLSLFRERGTRLSATKPEGDRILY